MSVTAEGHVAWADVPLKSAVVIKHGQRLEKLTALPKDRPPTPHVIRSRLVKIGKPVKMPSLDDGSNSKGSFSPFVVLPHIGGEEIQDNRRKSTGFMTKLGIKKKEAEFREDTPDSMRELKSESSLLTDPLLIKRGQSMRLETGNSKKNKSKLRSVTLPEVLPPPGKKNSKKKSVEKNKNGLTSLAKI